MEYHGKAVLVVGLARSGIAATKVLKSLGARVIANDIKRREELGDSILELETLDVELCLGCTPDDLVEKVDLIVISPSVPIDSPFIQKAQRLGREVISELELAYRLCRAPVIAITGTNGKTTTVTLTGEMLKKAGFNAYVLGNIGVPFVSKALGMDEDDIAVVEVSSFQLEAVRHFHPHVAAILNITPDHLNRHKTMENYIAAKARIFENCTPNDWVVLNADNEAAARLATQVRGQVLFFSRLKQLSKGAWVEGGKVVLDIGQGKEEVCGVEDIFIPGAHNLENALAAALMARVMGATAQDIAVTLKTFKGVEHRIEYVDTIRGVKFYNDSKGTNPDASIKAIQAMKGPTVLIAGGMDKGSSFDEFIDAFGKTVTHMVVLGETADKLIRTAKEKGFEEVYRVNTVEESVRKAFSLASPGYNVLFSPACASWDMFKDYEERGRVFKSAVRALKGEFE
ncbi:UDP-N-acetylmuramoylalanine--D-glutamate ligase [Caldicoprobacter guelmensis]|uniref:UDP-N-acetylmuramoyl-L-alanine--D-glutamate ligase n=1 Tax=Caldicoprobacter guelmensis TaxID=1170224 RepID=UPI0019560884|nr:UDP-N-acetylmuramoyl-L-alanine--D-glutamate ligase [Caldicoprobacter guelmensis]MBM7583306.1 UDP-N-acetylmuramoylalanine--D-glutamate ligase [Caldicoprobacter guelmensis]